jgi:hypothetical protein
MSELNDMMCTELADVAAELALGVLTGRERAGAIAHLNTCEACREDVRQLMATGEQLRELLPAIEPPAGFETRVLERLGLPAPASQRDQHDQDDQDELEDQDERHDRGERDDRDAWRVPGREDGPRRRRAGGDTARPGPARPGTARPGTAQAGAPPAGPGASGRPRRPGRMRRALAAGAVAVAVIAAGLGGWRVGVGSGHAASSLSSASLVSATRQHVGQVFLYSGSPGWLYMSVELGPVSGPVTCQVIDADGRVATIGSFRLVGGYGAWGAPNPGLPGKLTGARLVSANGTVLATGTFTAT